MNLRRLNKAFHDQKCRATERGIPFRLTFSEWLSVWQESGHINERGKGRGRYCMARHGDVGAYEIGNVKIITAEENRAEQRFTEETRQKMRMAKLGTKQSPETRAKRAASHLGRKDSDETKLRKSESKLGSKNPMFGRKASAETRAKLSQARRRYWKEIRT